MIDLESWELDFQIKSDDLSGEFKSFTKWFIETEIVNEVGFKDYIEEGPSLVEQVYPWLLPQARGWFRRMGM